MRKIITLSPFPYSYVSKFIYVILFLGFCSLGKGQQFNLTNPDVLSLDYHGISKEFIKLTSADTIPRSFARTMPKPGDAVKPGWILHPKVNPNALPLGEDPVWQKGTSSMRSSESSRASFSGQGFTNVSPADPSVAVGPGHVVQMINASDGAQVQIWDKAGNTLVPPFLMDGTSGIAGKGDPIVLYDQLANRWLLTEFADDNVEGNKLVCMVSTSPDPTGTYHIYSFTTPNFPDYPKYAVWPNAYFITCNEGDGQAIYAIDRTKMLAGDNSATIQRFTAPRFQTINFQAATPVCLAGTALPPVNAPGLIMRIADDGWDGVAQDRLEIYEVNIDFADVNNSSLVGPLMLPTEPFDTELCGYTSFSCIDQPNGGTPLDPLREVLMNKIYYRNFGSYEAIVASHVTDVSGNDDSGVRWYELRRVGNNDWNIYQQSTFAPDNHSRWMSSIGINEEGSIGLIYNISSTTLFPSIRYTGRLVCDPLDMMTLAETEVATGTAAQSNQRYGDYNDVSIDPVDNSFWFTGMFNTSPSWSTHIGSFSIINDCFGINLTSAQTKDTLCLPDSSFSYVMDVDYLGDFDTSVVFSIVDLPAGIDHTFSPDTLESEGAADLSLDMINLNHGTYNFIVFATADTIIDSLLLCLVYPDTTNVPAEIIAPIDGQKNVESFTTFIWNSIPGVNGYEHQLSNVSDFTTLESSKILTDTTFTLNDALRT